MTVAAGGLSFTCPGPASSEHESLDPTEPYTFTLSAIKRTELGTFRPAYDALSQAQRDATTLTLDDGVVATGDATAITAEAALGEATGVRIPLLSLADAPDIAGTENVILALLEVEISGSDITGASDLPAAPGGNFLAGDLTVSNELRITMVEQHGTSTQGLIRLRRQGGAFSDYWDNEGSPQYPEAKLYIQTSPTDNWALTIAATGSGFNNWTADDTAAVAAVGALVNGDRFIIRITTPATATEQTGDATAITAAAALGEASGTAATVNRTGSGTAVAALAALGEATGAATVIARVAAAAAITALASLGTATGSSSAAPTRTGDATAVTAAAALGQAAGAAATVARTGGATAITANATLAEATGTRTALLALSDWVQPAGTDNVILALVLARVSGVDFVSIAANPTDLLDGELEIASDRILDMLERHNAPADLIRMRATGGGSFSTYFGATAQYPGAKLYIQTDPSTVWAFTHAVSGSGFSNWEADDSGAEAVIDAIVTGDRLIWGITTPSSIPDNPGDATATTAAAALGEATGTNTATSGAATAVGAVAATGEATGTNTARTGAATAVGAVAALGEATGTVQAAGSRTGSARAVEAVAVLGEATGTRAAAATRTGAATAITASAALGQATGTRTSAAARTGAATAITASASLGGATGTRTSAATRTGDATAVMAAAALGEATGTAVAAGAVTATIRVHALDGSLISAHTLDVTVSP